MPDRKLLVEIKRRLDAVYSDRLKGVVLYGSEARGEAGPDSDIDVLVLLEGPVEYARELRSSIHALYPLTLELGRSVSTMVVEAQDYETHDCPLYRNARREGILL